MIGLYLLSIKTQLFVVVSNVTSRSNFRIQLTIIVTNFVSQTFVHSVKAILLIKFSITLCIYYTYLRDNSSLLIMFSLRSTTSNWWLLTLFVRPAVDHLCLFWTLFLFVGYHQQRCIFCVVQRDELIIEQWYCVWYDSIEYIYI